MAAMENMTAPFPFKLIRRRSQKKIRIRIDRTGAVVVSAPLFMPDRTLMTALEEKKSWVERHLASHRQVLESQDPLRWLTWQGLTYRTIGQTAMAMDKPVLRFDEESLICTFYTPDEEEINLRMALKSLLQQKARPLLENRLRDAAERTGIGYRQFQLRDQKTLWGSSSGRGCISLNWRIALLPPELQDYLICHELCHQRVMNHSPAFWEELEKLFSRGRQADKDLKKWRYLMDLYR